MPALVSTGGHAQQLGVLARLRKPAAQHARARARARLVHRGPHRELALARAAAVRRRVESVCKDAERQEGLRAEEEVLLEACGAVERWVVR